jgi:hypothetical protein
LFSSRNYDGSEDLRNEDNPNANKRLAAALPIPLAIKAMCRKESVSVPEVVHSMDNVPPICAFARSSFIISRVFV